MLEKLWAQVELNRSRFMYDDSFRVFHGRGQCYPGLEWLSIDFFKPALLFTVYRQPPGALLTDILEQFFLELNEYNVSVLLVQRRDKGIYELEEYKSEQIIRDLPLGLFAQRGSQKYKLSRAQQNIGFFLDIEPARIWLGEHVKGKSLLNLFAFTCAFSVVAISSGAESVVNVDMNRNALEVGRENHRLNNLPLDSVKFLPHDILRSWAKLKRLGPFDIIIVDPPSYQKGSFIVKKDYIKVLRKLPELVKEGGLALLCVNAPEISQQDFLNLILQANLPLEFVSTLAANPDFPDLREPNLCMLIYRVSTGLLSTCL